MPYLGDYLGHLMAEIAIARMQADLETVRIAELYAAHPLLRSMPVPHVRLPDVDLDVPVLIGKVDEARAGESPRGAVALPELRRAFDKTLDAHLVRNGLAVTAADRQRLAAALDSRLPLHDRPAEISVDVHRFADDLTAVAVKTLAEGATPAAPVAAPVAVDATELKEAARLALLKLRPPPPRLTVLVTSAEIREGATPDNLTRIKMKVSEQGVEWATVESEGTRRERLVPE